MKKTYKLYKPNRQNYVQTAKGMMKDSVYLGTMTVEANKEVKKDNK